jgi:2-C-methyl-D-erythritol 4-phosphate cytidylyltransferase
MNYVIIIAGGVGSRLGAPVPKQFVEVLGKPVIAYTMEHFQNHPNIDAIELVCVDGFQEHLQGIADKYGITKVMKIVKGGSEYERSIMNGVAGLKGIARPDDVVMIHWAASPFLSEEIISDNIRVCKEKGNAITASYSYLLYGTNDGDCAKKSINRETFMTLSAPQSFLYKVITDIYRQVEEKNMFDYVEAHTPAFMTELGIPIYFSKGSHANIKITTKEDIDLFLGYLLAQRYKKDANGFNLDY